MIEARRGGFRQFLVGRGLRGYKENSVRTFVNQMNILLKTARKLGWNPENHVSEEWKCLLALAAERKVRDIVRHFSLITRTPGEVTIEAVQQWGESKNPGGHAIRHSGVEEEPLLEAPTTDWIDHSHCPKPYPAREVRHSFRSDGTETQDGNPGSAEVETGRVCAQPPEERQDQGNLGREPQRDHRANSPDTSSTSVAFNPLRSQIWSRNTMWKGLLNGLSTSGA